MKKILKPQKEYEKSNNDIYAVKLLQLIKQICDHFQNEYIKLLKLHCSQKKLYKTPQESNASNSNCLGSSKNLLTILVACRGIILDP